jgi:hypothetical protein
MTELNPEVGPMRSVMRDFTFVSCLLVVALVLALAWRDPFVQTASAHAPMQAKSQQSNK